MIRDPFAIIAEGSRFFENVQTFFVRRRFVLMAPGPASIHMSAIAPYIA
jgi:hypothetical protein